MPTASGQLHSQYFQAYGRAPDLISTAPGRVNLIGEHTDYNSGFVLPAAIDRTVTVAASQRDDGVVRARSQNYQQSDEFPVTRVRRFLGTPGWRDYVRGVAWALQDGNIGLTGADMVIAGDVPQGAGLSSSAALEVAVAGAFLAFSGSAMLPRDVALACQKAENLFVGVQCGIMDQFAAALGQAGHALLIDCLTLETEAVPLPTGLALVIVDSGRERRLAETAYNLRRDECAQAAGLLGVGSLREADPSALAGLPDVLRRRARHVTTENARVLSFADALRELNLDEMGRLMYASHASLRDDFEVTVPELDLLVDLASRQPGVIGARMTGAGFGGCTVNLVREESAEDFSDEVCREYLRHTGTEAMTYSCRAADGLRVTDG